MKTGPTPHVGAGGGCGGVGGEWAGRHTGSLFKRAGARGWRESSVDAVRTAQAGGTQFKPQGGDN